MTIKNVIARNTIANFIGRGLQLGMVLVTTPLLISFLGLKLYGVWIILSTITNYYGLFDFGLNSSYIKYISEYRAREDLEKLRKFIATGFYSSLVIGILVIFSGYLLKDVLLSLFVKDYLEISNIYFIYMGTIILFSLAYLGQFFQSILDGYQRMDLKNISLVIQRGLNLFLIILFLVFLHKKIDGLILAGIITWVVFIWVTLRQAKKIFTSLSLSPKYFDKLSFKISIQYGWKIQITQFATWTITNVDKLFLGYFTTPVLVSIYDISYKIRGFTREPVIAFIGTLTPAASNISTNGKKWDVEAFYKEHSKYLMLLIFPLCSFTIINAAGLIKLWVGGGFDKAVIVLQVLMIGNIFNLITGCGTQIARGINRPGLEAKYTIWVTIFTVLFGYFFTKYYGLIGLAISSSLALGIPSLAFIFVFNRYLMIKFYSFFTEVLKAPLFITFVIVVIDVISNILWPMNQVSRLMLLLILTFKFIGYCVAYLVYLHQKQYLNGNMKLYWLMLRQKFNIKGSGQQ